MPSARRRGFPKGLSKEEATLLKEREDLRFKHLSWQETPIVMVDIDGTLSDPQGRLWRVKKPGKKDWDGFFAECDKDKPVEAVVRWVRELAKEYTIVLISGRPIDRTAAKTLWWLHHFNVPYRHIFMRCGGDHRPDTDVKEEILDDLLQQVPKSQILFAIDDRPSVVEHVWRKNGIRIFPVRSSDSDFY